MQMVYDYQLTRNLQNEPSFISEYQTRKAEIHVAGIYLRHLRHLWKIKEFPSPDRFHPIPSPCTLPSLDLIPLPLLHQEPSPDPVGHRQP